MLVAMHKGKGKGKAKDDKGKGKAKDDKGKGKGKASTQPTTLPAEPPATSFCESFQVGRCTRTDCKYKHVLDAGSLARYWWRKCQLSAAGKGKGKAKAFAKDGKGKGKTCEQIWRRYVFLRIYTHIELYQYSICMGLGRTDHLCICILAQAF